MLCMEFFQVSIFQDLEVHEKLSEHTFSGDPVTVAVNTTLLSV